MCRISGLVVLDLVRRELADRLHLDLVDHGVEHVLAGAEAGADEHGDDHPLLVLARLVAETNRRGLPVRPQLGLDDRRVEVQREGGHRATIIRRGTRLAENARRIGPLLLASRLRLSLHSPLWHSHG